MDTLATFGIIIHTLLSVISLVDNKGTCPIADQCQGGECLEYEDRSRYKEEKQVKYYHPWLAEIPAPVASPNF